MALGNKHVMLQLCHLLLLLLKAHSKCPKSYPCGNFTLEFPFTVSNDPDCGLFIVDGCDSAEGTPTLRTRVATSPSILRKTSTNAFLMHDRGIQESLNSSKCYTFIHLNLPESTFVSFTFSPNITIFTCYNQTALPQIQDYFQSYRRSRCETASIYYKPPPAHQDHAPPTPPDCAPSRLPIKSGNISAEPLHLLTADFTLEWSVQQDCNECHHKGGQCLSDNEQKLHCSKQGNTRLKKILFIGGITIASLASSLIIILLSIRRKREKAKQDRDRDIELFLKDNGNLVPMRYKYSSIKKMTSSFAENLGRGGFGSVYKGRFPDGRLVAVKVLNESNGNGEDFMNEVASISRTSHVNIVALLGFCFEGSKRALIYDFMPNGSLERFIGNNASPSPRLGWDKLLDIALGIARGLEYLHQGCNTRILHLDIKPQNILLDKDMNPRISDFGLAKLCPNRSSIVSMLMARGTIGYIAPEVFSRNFGDVSYKSDVYSYGMLVLEMVGGRTTVDRRDVDCTSEIYFPTYLYKQIEMNAERDGDLAGALDEEDESQRVKRNLIIVGLWCIQTNPKDRPSMTRVVEMLEGKAIESLEVPPKPYLYSPLRPPPSYSTSESL